VGFGIGIALALVSVAAHQERSASRPPTGRHMTATSDPRHPLHSQTRTVSPQERMDAIARAHVWRPPQVPIARAALGRHPQTPRDLSCRFQIGPLGGTTPKFRCSVADGTEIRVKYGGAPEIPAEAAATRLLTTLGFGADIVALVEQLRCYGCPREPFMTMKAVESTGTRGVYERMNDARTFHDFRWVAVEQRYDARAIETEQDKGWAFFELESVDASKGGAPRAHIDALRLLAMFLAHWDNKAENQRLVCRSQQWPEGSRCPEPFLLLQDVGATFGPRKVDLDAWEKAPLWEDRSRCTVSMRALPYGGATFGSARISERGRGFLVGLLGQLTDAQLADLFSGARFDRHHRGLGRPAPISAWVRVFKQRLRALSDGPPCPVS
jgi:hypothetical protein